MVDRTLFKEIITKGIFTKEAEVTIMVDSVAIIRTIDVAQGLTIITPIITVELRTTRVTAEVTTTATMARTDRVCLTVIPNLC